MCSVTSCRALPRLVRSGAYRPQDDAGFSWSQHFMRFLCARCVNSARPSVKRPNTKCQYYYSRNADTLCVFLCAKCVNSARQSGKHLNTKMSILLSSKCRQQHSKTPELETKRHYVFFCVPSVSTTKQFRNLTAARNTWLTLNPQRQQTLSLDRTARKT